MRISTAEVAVVADLEPILGRLIDDAAQQVQDPALRDRMHQSAERHHDHGQALRQQAYGEPHYEHESPLQGELQRRVPQTGGEQHVMSSLGHLAEEHVARIKQAIDSTDDMQTSQELQSTLADTQEDVRLFLGGSEGTRPVGQQFSM